MGSWGLFLAELFLMHYLSLFYNTKSMNYVSLPLFQRATKTDRNLITFFEFSEMRLDL